MTNEMRVFLMTAQGKEVMEDQQKRKVLLNDPKAIYQDHFVSVRPDCLIVKKFFLPSELPYEYSWRHILTMSYIPQNKDNRESVCGKGMDEEGRWWAVDLLRQSVDRELHLYNVRIEVKDGEPPKCGFTVIHIEQFLKACRPLLPYHCRLSGCVWSE